MWESESLVAQRVKDLALLLTWCRFNPWPRNFRMPLTGPKKKMWESEDVVTQP